ncbi:MAG: response regulator [Chloroflexota bacterium]|nr:response regulator [Chloroflexota bacterium]
MKPLHILIADDEAIIRLGLRTVLQEMGHRVVGAATDGVAAVKLARQSRPDLIILDIKMPGMDGLAAAEAIVAERPVPILILTAYSDRELVEQAATLAVQGYLVKPIREAELAPAIEIALARFNEWQVLQEEAASLQEALLTRDLVDQAKRLLRERDGLREREAFLHIHNRSRRQRRSMREVAEEVLRSGN